MFNKIIYILGDKKVIRYTVPIMFTLAIIDLIGVAILGYFISQIAGGTDIPSSINIAFETIGFQEISFGEYMVLYATVLILFFSLKFIISIYCYKFLLMYGYAELVKLRKKLVTLYHKLPYPYIQQKGFPFIATNISTHSDTFIRGVLMPLIRMYSDLVMLTLMIIFLVYIDYQIFLVFLILISLLFFVYWIFIKERARSYGTKMAKAYDSIHAETKHFYYSLRESTILNKQKYFSDPLVRSSFDFSNAAQKQELIIIVPKYVIELMIIVIISIITMVSFDYGTSDINNSMDVLGFYAAMALRVAPSINQILTSISNMRNGSFVVDRLFSELKLFNKLSGKTKAQESVDINFNNSIKFDKVYFKYPSKNESVLMNVNIEINKGECVAIVGASGSGKSTLVNLLLGFIKPDSGSILIDNVAISDSNIFSWRQFISYIPQEINIIDKSIRSNITLSDDTEVDFDKLNLSIKRSSLQNLFDGNQDRDALERSAGPDGCNLSGGQRQRLILARSFYHDRGLIIMDEPTSALDRKSEADILQYLQEAKGDKTIIIVTHSQKVIDIVDRVVQLK